MNSDANPKLVPSFVVIYFQNLTPSIRGILRSVHCCMAIFIECFFSILVGSERDTAAARADGSDADPQHRRCGPYFAGHVHAGCHEARRVHRQRGTTFKNEFFLSTNSFQAHYTMSKTALEI